MAIHMSGVRFGILSSLSKYEDPRGAVPDSVFRSLNQKKRRSVASRKVSDTVREGPRGCHTDGNSTTKSSATTLSDARRALTSFTLHRITVNWPATHCG